MIRRPTDHFESVFNGYQLDMLLGIQNSSNPFDEFLSKPKQYLLEYLRKKPRLNIHLNMAKNGITYIHIYTYILFRCTCIGPRGVLNKVGFFVVVVFFVLFCFVFCFFTGRLCPEVQPFVDLLLTNGTPFTFCIPFNPSANKLSLKY